MEASAVVTSLAALAQSTRLELFRALVVAGPQGMTPGTMAQGLGISASALSFHLKALTQAGLVSAERASRNLIYRAEFAHMNALLAYLSANCCAGQPCDLEPAACDGCASDATTSTALAPT